MLPGQHLIMPMPKKLRFLAGDRFQQKPSCRITSNRNMKIVGSIVIMEQTNDILGPIQIEADTGKATFQCIKGCSKVASHGMSNPNFNKLVINEQNTGDDIVDSTQIEADERNVAHQLDKDRKERSCESRESAVSLSRHTTREPSPVSSRCQIFSAHTTREPSPVSSVCQEKSGNPESLHATSANFGSADITLDQCTQRMHWQQIDENAQEKDRSFPQVQLQDSDVRDDWRILAMLGEGCSATVYNARRKAPSPIVGCNAAAAVKVARASKESDLVKEATFLEHLGRHPHIVEMVGFYHSKTYGTALVLEFLGAGTILQLVEKPIREKDVKMVVGQVCQALSFVHSRGIVHRDVKAENIVMSGKGTEVKLVDFGTAGLEEDDEEMMRRCGSPGYIAPEVISGERCSFVADIFGLGVVTYLLISGRLPFQGKTTESTLRRNLRCHVQFKNDIWFGFEEARSFCEYLIVKDPNTRPVADDSWKHPWFSSLFD